jgi:hypothetical protein
MGLVVEGCAPVSYALYPVQRSRRVLRSVLLGGTAVLALVASAVGGYFFRAHQRTGGSVAVVSAPLVAPIDTYRSGLGRPAAPDPTEVGPATTEQPRPVPAAGTGVAGPIAVERAPAPPPPARRAAAPRPRSKLARAAATARPAATARSAAPAGPEVKPKHEVSDAELQRILDGE